MTAPETAYGRADEVMLALGLGLVLIGAAVIGFFETLLGSAHMTRRIAGVNIVVHTSFGPHLRAYTIALGFLVLFVWGLSRLTRAAGS